MARKSETMAKAAKAAAAKNNHEIMKAMKAMKQQKAMKAMKAMKTMKAMKAMKAMKTKMSAKPAATAPRKEYPDGFAMCHHYILLPITRADIAQLTVSEHPELKIMNIPELTEREHTQLIERMRIALSRQADAETGWPATDLITSLLRSGVSLGLTPLDKLPQGWCT